MADELPLSERLIKGAGVLGRLFRQGKFCQNGWGQACTCPQPTEFCLAKLKWISLALGDPGRDVLVSSPFYVLELMKCSEADALGLEVTVNFEGIGVISVGKGGQIPWGTLARYASEERAADGRAVLMILAKFPKSCIIPEKEVPHGEGTPQGGAPGVATAKAG
jgi:hypothetical protein